MKKFYCFVFFVMVLLLFLTGFSGASFATGLQKSIDEHAYKDVIGAMVLVYSIDYVVPMIVAMVPMNCDVGLLKGSYDYSLKDVSTVVQLDVKVVDYMRLPVLIF